VRRTAQFGLRQMCEKWYSSQLPGLLLISDVATCTARSR
jgi:hypothetical protein